MLQAGQAVKTMRPHRYISRCVGIILLVCGLYVAIFSICLLLRYTLCDGGARLWAMNMVLGITYVGLSRRMIVNGENIFRNPDTDKVRTIKVAGRYSLGYVGIAMGIMSAFSWYKSIKMMNCDYRSPCLFRIFSIEPTSSGVTYAVLSLMALYLAIYSEGPGRSKEADKGHTSKVKTGTDLM